MNESKKPEAMRFDANKLQPELIPIEVEIELARVFSVGALKYEPNNWQKGMDWSRCVGPLRRHWLKFLMGERVDAETGCHHLAQVIWNAAVLMYYDIHGIGNDDRKKLEMDSNFNWIGSKVNLGIGLPPEKLQEIKDKYADLREAHKTKEAAKPKEVK